MNSENGLKTAESLEEKVDQYRLSPEEFIRLRRTSPMAYVFDLRQPEVYESGSIAGSYNLPFTLMADNLHRLPFSGDMLFHDDGEGVAAQAMLILEENGMSDFFYVEEGYQALLKAMEDDPEEVNYTKLSPEERSKAVEAVLDDKVREFLARDGGGLEVMAIEGDQITVAYQGACGGCASSTEGTLRFIQTTLTNALNHPITVIPVE